MLVAALAACDRQPTGWLELTVRDSRTGTPTPARLEILGPGRTAHVPEAALAVAGDCGWLPVHNWIGWTARWQMQRALRREVPNPFTGTTQFYLAEPARIPLPPGRYDLAAAKGLEYRIAADQVEVREGETTAVALDLERWVDLPAEGWVGADDHLHISRPSRGTDELIGRWMQAEDLHVANLLQMGLAQSLYITPQYGFGAAHVHRDGDTLVASGQEAPRTHVLGHSITLGAPEWIDFPERYLAYDQVWREARRQGAISGFAHWGVGGADEGLALWMPERLHDFLEVLGFGLSYYEIWYQLLDMGIRLTPTAGTDYPCAPTLPGRERFYTRLDGPLTYDAWIAAVRRGRTFITNGPVPSLRVEGVGIGEELQLPGPQTLEIAGRVRFDPERDDVERLELVGAGGEVLVAVERRSAPGEIRLRTQLPVQQSTWLALRASGSKRGETPVDFTAGLRLALTELERSGNEQVLEHLPADGDPRPSAAHTAPIFVQVAGTPALGSGPRARRAAAIWLARLDELEARFASDRMGDLAGFPGRGDGLKLEDLEAGREELLRAIASARLAYRQWASANAEAEASEPGLETAADLP